MFNIAAIASIRWLAIAAHIGPGSLALWAGAAVFFFVPLALSVTGLTARFPEHGGIYNWTAVLPRNNIRASRIVTQRFVTFTELQHQVIHSIGCLP